MLEGPPSVFQGVPAMCCSSPHGMFPKLPAKCFGIARGELPKYRRIFNLDDRKGSLG